MLRDPSKKMPDFQRYPLDLVSHQHVEKTPSFLLLKCVQFLQSPPCSCGRNPQLTIEKYQNKKINFYNFARLHLLHKTCQVDSKLGSPDLTVRLNANVSNTIHVVPARIMLFVLGALYLLFIQIKVENISAWEIVLISQNKVIESLPQTQIF